MANIWFGNLKAAQWVPAPQSGMGVDMIGPIEAEDTFNGGANVMYGDATSNAFDMAWGTTAFENLLFLKDYRQGIYGTGLLYFVDPFISDINVMPPHWATPSLSGGDWPSHLGAGLDPVLVDTFVGAQQYGLPIKSAKYALTSGVNVVPDRKLTLLIPPDKTLHLGFTGTATNAVVRVERFPVGGGATSTTDLTLLSATGSTRLNASFSGATYSAIRVYLTATSLSAPTVTLTAGKAVYAPTGTPPTLTGNHVTGLGHAGLRFSQNPRFTYIQARTGKKYASANAAFTEVGNFI